MNTWNNPCPPCMLGEHNDCLGNCDCASDNHGQPTGGKYTGRHEKKGKHEKPKGKKGKK